MFKTLYLSALLFGLLQAATPAQTQLEVIKARAEESAKAMLANDFGKLADLTYPKVVELMGGRAKMIAYLEKEIGKMRADGFDFLSANIGQPGAVIKSGDKLFSVVPMTLKMKVPGGVLRSESFLLGIAGADGRAWTFVSGAGMDEPRMKLIIPEAVGKVPLPPFKEPVLEKNPTP